MRRAAWSVASAAPPPPANSADGPRSRSPPAECASRYTRQEHLDRHITGTSRRSLDALRRPADADPIASIPSPTPRCFLAPAGAAAPCDASSWSYGYVAHSGATDTPAAAKHRVAKDFVCPVCSKGFARKDILKRHQQGHEKQAAAAAEAALRGDVFERGYDSQTSTGTVKSKKKRVQSVAELPVEDSGPVKIARVGRACCRCSKSKYVQYQHT